MEPLCRIRDILRSLSDFEVRFQNKYGIGLNEGMLLCSITKHGRCSAGQVAELLGLTSSNASKVIASAEKKGLLERIMGKEDKRQMYFSVTKDGEELLKRVKGTPEDIIEVIERIKTM